MDTKEFHKYYKNMLEEIFSDDFKKCMLEAEIRVFGEENKSMLETNMGKVVIHPKVNLLIPVDGHKRAVEQQSKYERQADLEVSKDGKNPKMIENQKKLLFDLMKRLNEEEVTLLKEALEKHEEQLLRGSFQQQQSTLDDLFDNLFNGIGNKIDEDKASSKFNEIVERFNLGNEEESKKFWKEYPEIEEYWKRKKEIELSQYTNYYEIYEELKDYDLSELDLANEYMEYASGSFVTPIKNNNTGKYEYHVFINPLADKDNLYHIGAHEILHAAEYVEKEIDGKIKFKTGHKTFDDEENQRYTMISEILHDCILIDKIQPILKENGYECTASFPYLMRAASNGILKFYRTFKKEIIRVACQIDNKELTDIIGIENWNSLADNAFVGEISATKQEAIVNAMFEHAKGNLTTGIGKDTIDEQYDVVGKKKVEVELQMLKEMQKNEITNASTQDTER